MNSSSSPDTANAVFDTYLAVLRKTFDGEPWDDIERWAERVWTECREEDDASWESIRDRVQAEWQVHA